MLNEHHDSIMKTNEEIRKDVMEQIKSTPELFSIATEIGVASEAERVAWSYPGVENVDNGIVIETAMFA